MKFYSEHTKQLYDTAEQCATEEAAFLKAEEDKKNSRANALAELDACSDYFKKCQKEVEAAQKVMLEASKQLRQKYVDFQKNFGRLPENHYTNLILTRLL